MERILILNKIVHKQIIIEKIFPYALDRPFIFPYLINNDIILKSKLKNSFKSLKKKNSLSKEVNDIYYKFIFCRLLYETNFNKYITDIDYTTKYINNNKIYNKTIITFYFYFFKNIFEEENNNKKFFNKIILDKFIIDYLKYHKKIVLFIQTYNYEKDINFINTFKNIKDVDTNLIIFYGYNIYSSYKCLINLLCEINNNFKINKVEFSIISNYINVQYFYNLLFYINNDNIKEIIFHESFSQKNNDFLESLSYVINNNKKYINLKSLEKIIYEEPDYLDNDEHKKIFVRYTINNFFSSKGWCNLVIIKPDDFNNIKNLKKDDISLLIKKINKFEEDENKDIDSKILYIDFENNSPFQENFIYFWNKYLGYNESFNKIYYTNIGKINYSQICYEEIKNNKNLKSYFSNLKDIHYINNDNEKLLLGEKGQNEKEKEKEKENENEKDIIEFINLFFYLELENSFFIYKIYIGKYLKYLYYTDKLTFSYIKTEIKDKKFVIKIYIDNIEIEYEYNGTFKIKKKNNNILEENTIIKIYKFIEEISSNISKIKKFDINIEDLMNINLLNNYNSEILKNKKQYETIFKGFDKILYINKILLLTKNDNLQKLYDIFITYNARKLLLIIETNDGYIFGTCSNFNQKKHKKNFVFDITNDKIFICLYGFYSDLKFGIKYYFKVSANNSTLSLYSLCLKDLKVVITNKLIDIETSSKIVTKNINKLEAYELVYIINP